MENSRQDRTFAGEMENKSHKPVSHQPAGGDGLGNVHLTLSDYRRKKEADGQEVIYYSQINSASDYYPFGQLLTDGNYSSGDYRFGFNSQEKDDEIYGQGNSYSAEFWQYDARLGRRWNVDPVNKPHESSYASFANNPFWFVDPVGLDTVEISSEKGEIENHIETKEGDDVFFIMEDGKRKESRTFDDGFIENIDEDILDNDGDVYRLRGDDDSQELFEFYADNIEIEFSLTRTGKEGTKGLNFETV
ncbi:MAG: hypothetical protein K9J21_06505 [Bacteroidales bacterium]|nr:hypothetical protein [Bacteroidales bacterium]